MDTRESGPELAAQLASGLRDNGCDIHFAGVVPTPAIAFLTRTHGFTAGVVISASHNPWQDNGIKIFGSDGYKLADSAELAIEQEIFNRPDKLPDTASALEPESALVSGYIDWLLSEADGLPLGGQKIVVDCANGAACTIAPQVLRKLGADVIATHAAPNGRNINQDCGALHAEVVARETAEQQASIGITFDGDADRVLFATSEGKVVNGDGILLLASESLQAQGRLANSTVVATTMSNMGLESLLAERGVRMLRAPVGDKYVIEEMQKTGAVLGGEQSGHIIFSDRATTGDGLFTALVVLGMVARSGKTFAELVAPLKTFPQTIVNIRVREKPPLNQIPGYAAAQTAAEQLLGNKGRIVVRYSGTEKLARVMVEAEDEAVMRQTADHLAEIIRNSVGE
jgi:phosphoglucosamine mutase